ncbi:MAG: PucR family transcriptional regulator ligand-binding domain-containing protein [Microbacterium sp.]
MAASDRQDLESFQTERPRRASALLSVSDVLADPAVQAGAPEIVVGGAALDAEVRWVHVSDSTAVARLLNGGELLLSTGAGWSADPIALREFVRALHRTRVAGIVVELGVAWERMPDAVAQTCAELGLALIALTSEVKFVTVTEAVHRALIDAQTEALRERQRLHELFTALSLQGAAADIVVAETARAIGAPVVLQNLAGEVIAIENLRMSVADALEQLGSADQVPVQARGVRWGVLSALPGPVHPAGRITVLEQGATALAFGCLAAGGADEWSLLAQGGLIRDLLGGRYVTPVDIAARLAAGGFLFDGRVCHGIVARGAVSASELAYRARQAGCAVVAASVDGDDVAVLSLPASDVLSDQVATRIAGADRTVFVGPASDSVLTLLASLRSARDLAASDSTDAEPRVRRVEERPLERLVSTLRDDHRLHEHSERMLAPLIAYDRERRGDLLAVLSALVAHPGNRSQAASASHLSRSVFYQRLALIEDLLDADLDDGETLAALHVAIMARRSTRAN